jgi:PAS domain S-box-containing protein
VVHTATRSPTPLAFFDLDRRLLGASRSFEQIVGIQGRDYVGQRLDALIPDLAPELIKLHRRAAAGENLLHDEEVYVDSDGERRWLSCEYRPVPGPNGEVAFLGYFVHGHDVTPMIAARREAQANAERLRMAMDAARVGAFETDYERRTFWCSPEFVRIVGRELTFQEASRVWPLVHPEDVARFEAAASASLSARSFGRVELRVLNAAGDEKWIEVSVEPHFDAEGAFQRAVGFVIDIDARKRQELALNEARHQAQANAERLRLALGAARAGVCELDFVAKTIWYSPEWVELVGSEAPFREFAINPWPMCHPDDRPNLDRAMAAWTGPRHEPLDLRMVLPSGETRWVQVHAEQQIDANSGKRAKIVGLIIDIDARKRQELALLETRQELQANGERLKLAMDAAQAGAFETNLKEKTFWCSPEFVEIVGRQMTFEEALGVWPMSHPEDVPKVQAHIDNAHAGATSSELEWRLVMPDGQVRWIDGRAIVHLDENGVPEKVAGLVLDIDARKRQELALTEVRREAQINADRLGLAMSAAKAGVCEIDFASKSMWCSPEFVEILGREYSYEEFVTTPWPMCHPDDRDQIDKMRAAWGSGRHEPVEFRIVLPDSGHRWVQVHGERMLGEDGQIIRTVGLLLDIDVRKRQELALVEAERAAQAAADAKSEFLANMSHEIRTPMNGVLGVLHLLASENLSEEGRMLLVEAGNCGRMLSQLLDDVIDFSRVEAGRLELSPEPMNAAQVLESVVGLLRPNAQAKGLDLRVQVEGKAGEAWILADPVRMRQALFNLIGNAVKFTSQGHVEARLSMRGRGKRRRMRFEIEDTGVGIPEAAQAALFSRFQQADGSTSRKFGGSGLGLAITRRLAEMMGGRVEFTSKEGEGSTFWFEIVADRAEAPSTDIDPAEFDLSGLKILLVEDNPTNRLVAGKMLEAMGMSVATAEHGGLGVQAAQTEPFDLILMDVQMPVMDGLEATRRIRGLDSRAARTPILGLTANAMAHQRIDYMAAGMNGVVAKPISPAALVAEIARVMAEHASAPETAAA